MRFSRGVPGTNLDRALAGVVSDYIKEMANLLLKKYIATILHCAYIHVVVLLVKFEIIRLQSSTYLSDQCATTSVVIRQQTYCTFIAYLC